MLFEKLIKKSSILFIVFISNASFADTVIEVKAEPNKGFYFPFLLKIPSNIETNYLIVETNNTGAVSDDFEVHYQSAKKAIVGNAVGPWVAKKVKLSHLDPSLSSSED
jgi:hypothetical protein